MPTRLNPKTGKNEMFIFVRVVSAHMTFNKDELIYPDKKMYPNPDELLAHKDDPPVRREIVVLGFDEIGRPTCPVFEVPDCGPVQAAIHNEIVKDAKDTSNILYTGRLVQVMDTDVENYPRWIGHPTVNDKPEEIHRKIVEIRKNQKIGDGLLNLDEPSEPYMIRKPTSKEDIFGAELWNKYIGWLAKNPDKAAEVDIDLKAMVAAAKIAEPVAA